MYNHNLEFENCETHGVESEALRNKNENSIAIGMPKDDQNQKRQLLCKDGVEEKQMTTTQRQQQWWRHLLQHHYIMKKTQ